MLRWYLIHTKPAAESVAQANLRRQSYEVHYPRVLQQVRLRGRRQSRPDALFPRYLFLRLREGLQALGPVRSTVGVADLVRFGSEYALVTERIIRELRAREDPATGMHRLQSMAFPRPGTAVRLSGGAFEGLEGVFERAVGSDRIAVLLRLLGRDVPACVPADSITVAYAG